MKRRMPDNKLQDALLHTLATFEHFDPETEALFLGSSHTVYGFAPKNCRRLRAWNAGFNSGDLKMAYYTYQALRDKWPKQPGQCVVISEDFFMNSTRCEFSSEFYQPLLLSQFSAFRFDKSFRLAPHRRLIAQRSAAVRASGIPEAILAERGFIPNLTPNLELESAEAAIARARRHCKMAYYTPSQLPWLEQLKAAVIADERTLIFLRYPASERYRKTVEATGIPVWKPAESLREGCPLLDYFDAPVPPEHWIDDDHFTDAGARAFTQTLEPVLLNLMEKIAPLCAEKERAGAVPEPDAEETCDAQRPSCVCNPVNNAPGHGDSARTQPAETANASGSSAAADAQTAPGI